MKDDAGQKKTCHNVIKAIGIAAGAILVIVVLSLVLPCVIAAGETSDSQSGITVQREISPVFAGIDQEVQVRYVISNTGAVDGEYFWTPESGTKIPFDGSSKFKMKDGNLVVIDGGYAWTAYRYSK